MQKHSKPGETNCNCCNVSSCLRSDKPLSPNTPLKKRNLIHLRTPGSTGKKKNQFGYCYKANRKDLMKNM